MKHIAIAAALLLGGCTSGFSQQGQDALDKLAAYSQRDLDRAYGLAVLNKNQPAMDCIQAIKLVAAGQQSYKEPPGVFTTLQMGLDITDPNGYLNQQCLALRQQIKERVQLFLGKSATILATFGL